MKGFSRAGLKCKCGRIVEPAPDIPNSYYLICVSCDECSTNPPQQDARSRHIIQRFKEPRGIPPQA